MAKTTEGSYKLIQPIINAIDEEMQKEKEYRIDFPVIPNTHHKVSTIKKYIEDYIKEFKPEWKGRFQIRKNTRENSLTFNFNAVDEPFNINKKVVEEGFEAFTINKGKTSVIPPEPFQEMSESEAAIYMLGEAPNAVSFLLDMLNENTQDFVRGSPSSESAFIALMERRGYSWAFLPPNRLRIFLR